jgi:hypothetical protein
MKYEVEYMARKTGSIGVFYPVCVLVDAIDEAAARQTAFDQLHADGYETNYAIRVTAGE